MTAPIRIRCEGSGAIGHRMGLAGTYWMCPMCGRYPGTVPGADNLVDHDRDDIIAQIARGDYG